MKTPWFRTPDSGQNKFKMQQLSLIRKKQIEWVNLPGVHSR